jgi:ATP-dependent helicase/DNAse subunit B
LHQLYCRLYREWLRGRDLGELTDERIEELMESAGKILDEEGVEHARSRPATWQATRCKALQQLRQALRMEREENDGARPEHFEFAFGESEDTALVLKDQGDESVAVRGRIDRVDDLRDGGVQVIDYKSGSSRRYKKDSFQGGTQVQLPLYLLAIARQKTAGAGRARYFFITEPDFVPEFSLAQLEERESELQRIIELVIDGVRSGNFFLLPRETTGTRGRHCHEYCAYAPACGAPRDQLAEIKYRAATDPDLAGLFELWDIE